MIKLNNKFEESKRVSRIKGFIGFKSNIKYNNTKVNIITKNKVDKIQFIPDFDYMCI